MTTVKEIVKQYLEDNGYDGLYCDECGCEKDNLAPWCCEDFMNCKTGYYTKCNPETCPADGDCPWHIGGEKDDKFRNKIKKQQENIK